MGEGNGQPSRMLLIAGGGLLGKTPAHLEVLVVFPLDALGQLIQHFLAGGEQGMLQTGSLSPAWVPPAHIAIGPVDKVNVGHPPALKGVIGLGTAAGMDVDSVVPAGQTDVIVPG